jgi:hypothetical protein
VMRHLLVAVAFVACTGALAGQEARGLRVESNVAIRMWLPAGEIEVRGWDLDSVDLRGSVATGNQLVGGGTSSAVKFAVEPRRPGGTTLPSGKLVLNVPRGARLWIKSTAAVVSAHGLRGELDVLQVDGRTTLTDLRGVVNVESIDGTIALNRASGVLRVRSGAASVSLGAISGRLEVSTVGGAVTWDGRNATGDAVDARVITVGGEIRLDGSLPRGSALAIETHDGNVNLRLTDAAAAAVSASGGTQRISAGLASPAGKQSRITVRTFKGTVNAGTASGI